MVGLKVDATTIVVTKRIVSPFFAEGLPVYPSENTLLIIFIFTACRQKLSCQSRSKKKSVNSTYAVR